MPRPIRLALRGFRAAPVFTATALATLALCLGANLTIFALVDAVLLRPLPYPAPDRLVTIYHAYPKLGLAPNGASLTSYYERRGRIPALASLAAMQQAASLVGETGTTAREPIGRITPEFFDTLGIAPMLGRAFTPAEMTYQTDHVAMLSHAYWIEQYGGDPGVLDRAVRVDGIPRRIVGVLPAGFRFLSFDAPVYMPLSSEAGERDVAARHAQGTVEIARLRDGATLAEAQAQIDAHDRAHAAEFPYAAIVAESGFHTVVAPLHAEHVAAIRPTLLLLQVGALLLLAIGGVNLVNLWLVRATARARERAIRRALGACRRQVIGEVLTETLLVSAAGAVAGLLAADTGIRVLAVGLGAEALPLAARLSLDGRAVVVAIAGALAVGVAVAIPVIAFTLRGGLAGTMQAESRSATASRASERLRRGLIVAQIALAFLLLSGATLLGLSLRRAMAVAPGFAGESTLTAQFTLPWSGYHDFSAFASFFDRLLAGARQHPGVSAVGVVTTLPVTGKPDIESVAVPGEAATAGTPVATPAILGVTGDYFAAIGIPLRAGRYVDASDARRGDCTAVVDEVFASRHWPNRQAVGQRFLRGTAPGPDVPVCTVVGVVGAVKLGSLTGDGAQGAIYYPYQNLRARTYYVVVRSRVSSQALGPSLARLLRTIDPELPLTDVRTMDVRLADSLAPRRTPALVAGAFAVTALLLAAIGLYGVMAYAVAVRTGEFGLRLALGAMRADVLGLVVGQGVRLVAIGLALGLGAAWWSTAFMAPLLFGVSATDPFALAGVSALLAAVGLLASAVPALRAARLTPLAALRSDSSR